MYQCKYCKCQISTQAYLQTHEEFCAATLSPVPQVVKPKLRPTRGESDDENMLAKLQTKIEYLSKNFNNMVMHVSDLETKLQELSSKIIQQSAQLEQLSKQTNSLVRAFDSDE
jgi:hypothetical protein